MNAPELASVSSGAFFPERWSGRARMMKHERTLPVTMEGEEGWPMCRNTESVTGVLAFVEAHLGERLELERVARAAGYSKYHLHRVFTQVLGMTPHDYIQRRQLTEAAKLLAFSKMSILDIALTAGYESQQAFSGVFKAMYKKTPLEYRQAGVFYPLQLAFVPRDVSLDAGPWRVEFATVEDVQAWMDLVEKVIHGFPCLDEDLHRRELETYIRQARALIVRDGDSLVGAAAFSPETGNIDFLAAHPQYRHRGVTKALLDFMMDKLLVGRSLSVTTFRAGDRADLGQREEYQRLGFAEGELLTEFGYPTQRLILPSRGEAGHG